MAPHAALSLMPDDDFARATLPLFEEGIVEAVEWSFDVGWALPQLPDWLGDLLTHYSDQRRLYGHGVSFSTLSAQLDARRVRWLESLGKECARHTYQHISEHMGFMTAGPFDRGSPLPVPPGPEADAVGRAAVRRLHQVAGGIPIGLENLALAFTPTDCTAQGAFMNRLLEPVDGFVVLDLHNLYCQMRNFQLEAEVLLQTFPWSRVREIHISGGSEPQGFRRDTHDDLVPEEVWALLDGVRGRAPSLELIVLERLGGTIADPESFASEFRRLREVAERWW